MLRIICIACIGITTIFLCGCEESRKDVEKYVEQVKKSATGVVEKLPEAKTVKEQTYSADNLRSPFLSSSGKLTTSGQTMEVKQATAGNVPQQPRPDLDRPREYLEQFPLASLTMVGTLSKPNMNWGLVVDNKGMVHAVKVGDYMGQNSGKIIAITPDQIRLTELVPNGAGGWMQTRTALTLAVQKGSK